MNWLNQIDWLRQNAYRHRIAVQFFVIANPHAGTSFRVKQTVFRRYNVSKMTAAKVLNVHGVLFTVVSHQFGRPIRPCSLFRPNNHVSSGAQHCEPIILEIDVTVVAQSNAVNFLFNRIQQEVCRFRLSLIFWCERERNEILFAKIFRISFRIQFEML